MKANGGGTVVGPGRLRATSTRPAAPHRRRRCLTTPNGGQVSCQVGYLGGSPYLRPRPQRRRRHCSTRSRVLAPSQTQTDRYGVIAGLRCDINDDHIVRVAYYLRSRPSPPDRRGRLPAEQWRAVRRLPGQRSDRSRRRHVLQKRDRQSIALLHQISGEYRGEFFDSRLTVNVGVRAPFFTRDLTNNCATSSASGFVECFGTNAAASPPIWRTTRSLSAAALLGTAAGPAEPRVQL